MDVDEVYFKSDRHIENCKIAGVLGNAAIKIIVEKNKKYYYENPKLCKECFCAISYDKKNTNLFCSSSCAASFNNKKEEDILKKQKIK